MSKRATFSLLALGLSGTLAMPASAIELHAQGGWTVDLDIEMGSGAFLVDNPNFGLGRIDLATGENTGDTTNYEAYIKPRLSFSYEAGGGVTFYGAVSSVITGTLGDGDAGGYTAGDDADSDLEEAALGLRFNLTQGENPLVLDISGGRQDLQIGNGWLFQDGNFDAFSDNAFWLGPRTAFRNTGIVTLSNDLFGFTGFYVKGDSDNDRAEVAGADLVFTTDYGTFGLLYAEIRDSDEAEFARRGMEMVSLRALDVPIPAVEGLTLSGEYTEQFGGKGGNDFDAQGYYGQISYSFPGLRFEPTLSYRYSKFSGQDGSSDITAFDPLFYGAQDWGTWVQGEIVGEYLLFNSNQRSHMVHLSGSVNEKVGIGAIYYRFDLDKKDYFGTPVTSKKFADEINFYVDWEVDDNLSVGALAGVAFPGSAAKQAFGSNDNIYLLQAFAIVSF